MKPVDFTSRAEIQESTNVLKSQCLFFQTVPQFFKVSAVIDLFLAPWVFIIKVCNMDFLRADSFSFVRFRVVLMNVQAAVYEAERDLNL